MTDHKQCYIFKEEVEEEGAVGIILAAVKELPDDHKNKEPMTR